MRTEPIVNKLMPLARTWLALVLLLGLFSGCSESKQNNSAQNTPAISDSEQAEKSIRKSTEKSGVRLDIEVYPKEPRLSDIVDLTITIIHPSATQIEPPVFGQSVGDFAVRDYSQRSIPAQGTEKTVRQSDADSAIDRSATQVIRYQLEPMFSGKHLIRSIPVVLIQKSGTGDENRDIIQSDPIEINVVSEFGDVSADLSQVDPMTDPIALEQNWLWLILAAVCIAAVSIALAYWLLNRRQTLTVVVPTLSPEDVAHRALAELIAEELPSRGMVKEFYLRLTGIVRVFIEGKTGLRAPEQTTEEFLRDMRASSRFDGQQAFRLQEFLTAADLVKYAGQTPDESSIMHSLERAREFIAIRFQDSNEPSSTNQAAEGNHG